MARIKTIKLRENRSAFSPGAAIIDADFVVVRGKKRGKRFSPFAFISFTLLALAFGSLAGFFAPTAFAQIFTALAFS